VEYGHDKEGFFFRDVRNQKIPHELKTQRPRSQIRTDVAQLREWDEGANRFLDLPKDTIGSVWTIGSDVFPNFSKICERVRMENKSAHERRRSWLFWRNWSNACSPSMGFTRPLLMSS
jgi:hypothetical protein